MFLPDRKKINIILWFKALRFSFNVSVTVTRPQCLLSQKLTFFSIKFMLRENSLLFSPCCLMSLKIKLTHSASLLCRCNYKSSLSLCAQGKRSQQPSEGVAEGLTDDERWEASRTASGDQNCSGDRWINLVSVQQHSTHILQWTWVEM